MEEILETYKKALAEYKAKNYEASLEILDGVITAVPQWMKSLMLKAYILREQDKTVELFFFMQKILSTFGGTSPDEKQFMATALNIFGIACQKLALPESATELLHLAADNCETNAEACTEISNAIFTANASEKFSADDFKKLYAEYKKYLSDITPYPKKFYDHAKIRVGFLSADFRMHSVIKWAWALTHNLDKKFFETYFYSVVEKSDAVTEHLQMTAENWRDISKLEDAQAAELIHNDEIDILFDLSGHTSGNRLRIAAYRLAAVQISGVGYMNSTGLECFDYFLSDETCAENSAAMSEYFTEKIIRLPHSHICYEPPPAPKVADAPPCLKNNFVTFACFNQPSKFTDSLFRAWKKIFDALPDSRLILKSKLFEREDGRKFFRERFKTFGIDAARVEMRGSSGTIDFLNEYADADIALDTFPYTGGVTTCDALYMGVPVISLYGERHGTRFGLSILKNVGVEELAVNSYEDYVKIAVTLANKKELLTDLRKNLRGMMKNSPLMDSKNYIREIQEVFVKILHDNRSGYRAHMDVRQRSVASS